MTKIKKTQNLSTNNESIYAKIWLAGGGKVRFSKTPQNLPKMDIIEEYILGGLEKVQVLHHFGILS